MAVFNPKILDASIRDVASYLSDNQKVDLLLYAIRSLPFEGRSRPVIENAIQSCLQVSMLSPENVAKARILRARARIANGWLVQAQDDLQAALEAEPDNPEAKALLHQRSVAVEKLLSPMRTHYFKERISNEVWREIALHLPRRDLKALLFVPHPLSRIASQLLFWELDLHFAADALPAPLSSAHAMYGGPSGGVLYGGDCDEHRLAEDEERDARREDAIHAQRSADILTRIITDAQFASAVRTLRIYALRREEGSIAFQTGMLTNALPRLINLRNVHLSSTSDGIVSVLRILQTTSPRLRGLSLKSPDGPADLSFLDFRHLAHFSYATGASGSAPPPTTATLNTLLGQNRNTLRTLALDLIPSSTHHPHLHGHGHSHAQVAATTAALSSAWTFPAHSLSTRNLTAIFFTGSVPANSPILTEVLTNGRQLDTLALSCTCLASSSLSAQIRNVLQVDSDALPFLRHFALTVGAMGRRVVDRDLFPALAEFLRGRQQLRSLHLEVPDEDVQRSVGFDASCWGVLPSLGGLKGLRISYPPDLAPGLAGWLVPRGVLALRLVLGGGVGEAGGFLGQLRPGIPPALRFIGLSELPVRSPAVVVELGFPMVRVLRIGNDYWTVHRRGAGPLSYAGSTPPPGSSATYSPPSATVAVSADATSSTAMTATSIAMSNAATMAGKRPLALAPAARMRMLPAGQPHPHSHAHTNGGGISSTGASVAVGGGAGAGPVGRRGTSSSFSGSTGASGGYGTSGATSSSGSGGTGSAFELEQWPRRRALYHATEWLEWLGCEDAMIRDPSAFAA